MVDRWRSAFENSLRALRHLLRHEVAFRQEAIAFMAAVPAAFVISTDLEQFLLLIVVIVLVMIVETLNTALEAVCDAVSTDFNAQIGLAKDCGSLAVLMSMLIAGLVWGLAILDWLLGGSG